ncbi:MAG: hypothetical protein IJL26_08595 [Clostridia bacterium]|nr:hypothetical protein [Clostridia bacterium]
MNKLVRIILAFWTCISILFTSGFGPAARYLKNIDPAPVAYPRAAVEARRLLLVGYPSESDALTVGSLQGILANTSETQIFIRNGMYEDYLPYTGAGLVPTQPDGAAWDAASLLKEYGSFAKGYVLCDDAGAAAAVSVAGVLQAVIVTEALEQTAVEAGLAKCEDVRGWDDAALRKSGYFKKLNDKIAVEQPVSYAPKLVDLAVMAGAYFGFSDSADMKDHWKVFSFLKDNAVIFGWNPVLGEHDTVQSFSEMNMCLIPADHGCNYSTLSGFSAPELRQKTAEPAESAGQKHTVCLMMSDGDNLQWMTNQYADGAHYGSALRGGFPMGWGVPASIASVASPVADFLFDNMTANDEFITHISGLGYTFPSGWNNPAALEIMAKQLAENMAKTDTHIAAVLDDHGFDSKALDTLASQDGIDALFYVDYQNYAGYEGAVRPVGDTPIISARYRLWAGLEGCSPEEIAAKINAAPTDPADPDAYSLIVVHAWSGLDADGNFVEGGDTMKAVRRFVDALDENVRIVTPREFAEVVKY